MKRVMLALSLLLAFTAACCAAATAPPSWQAPDRAAKVAQLIPGKRVPRLTPDTLFAEWTAKKVEQWNRDHEPISPEEACHAYSQTKPTDDELIADFPDHIAPFGRVLAGKPDPKQAAGVMVQYCPFCGTQWDYYGRTAYEWDPDNPYHAVTQCCRKHLYGREQDFPPDYDLRPDHTVEFVHLDDTVKKVPACVYTDKAGVQWQLFISTLFAHRRWLAVGNSLVVSHLQKFKQTADPLYAHKIAVLLDHVADTYYGLPLCHLNRLAQGKDGQPLTRVEWEAVPRPAIFELSCLGAWNRRCATGSPGWLNAHKEHIWVEPFARVRHHPAFKHYSLKRYGDPDALDRKIRTKLLRELKLMFESVFSQRLKSNYQDANCADLMLLGVLLEDDFLFDFAVSNQELTLYNHHYHDGMNHQGAPNYMAMLQSSYYPFMKNVTGWLEFEPDFIAKNPFFEPASTEWKELHTARGLPLEFGDQHMWPFRNLITDHATLSENEALPSMNWPGYGVGVLRVGGPGHRQEIRLSYDKVSLHGCSDKLGIGCWVDGVPVMRPGGYAYDLHAARLDESRPEIKAFRALDYPKEIVEAHTNPRKWCREYGSSHLAQNAVSVDERGTSRGWQDNEGFGELITFKGGERAGTLGANFQVLDVRDHDSFDRVDVEVNEFRRTLLAVEGTAGRPYVVDILRLNGGQRHALYQSAWAERAEDSLPSATSMATNLAEALLEDGHGDAIPRIGAYRKVRQVEKLGLAPPSWGLTWKTDYAAYAPRPLDGKPFSRPLPDDVGRVRLRLIGLQQKGDTQILRAKGPWIPWINQLLPGGKSVSGYVGFLDACDFLVESRTVSADRPNQALDSTFVHILEGFREGEQSVIENVEQVAPAEALNGTVALKLTLAGGHTDTVVFQPEPGTLRCTNGLVTDARYALIRSDSDGSVIEANLVRGTQLECGTFSARVPGDLTGTIVDVIGDLTGTRMESALIVRPDASWPTGGGLSGRQMLIRVTNSVRSDSNEAYTTESVTPLDDGLLRVNLANHAPFAVGWHQVTTFNPGRPNSLKTNRTFSAGINTSWLHGLRVWFPRAGKTYTFKKTDSSNGTRGAVDLELVEGVDLVAEGIKLGDWFTVHAVEPGLKVTVPGEFVLRRERLHHGSSATSKAKEPMRYSLRATGEARISMSDAEGPVWCRTPDGKWQKAKRVRKGGSSVTTITVDGKDSVGGVALVANKPVWLNLEDSGPPRITKVLLDGKALELQSVLDLGRIEPPKRLILEAIDDDNPIDLNSIVVSLDGAQIQENDELVQIRTDTAVPARSITVGIDLARALAVEDQEQPTRHTVRVTLDDVAIDEAVTSLHLTYDRLIKVPDGTLYLSDLEEADSRVHGGLKKDTDYYGNPLKMRGVLYPKALYAGPEYATPLAYSEIIYELPGEPGHKTFRAVIGICDNCLGSARATGVVYEVHVDRNNGWEVMYTSPTLAGPTEPLAISVDISKAKRLKLYCRDIGDGISADYAVWASARLE